MKLLCLDIGSGTQDILFLDTAKEAENAVQLVLPAPTVVAAGKIQAATKRGDPVYFAGETMGGGACTSAMRDHLAKGLPVYATEKAARTFHDDLAKVTSWGVRLVSEDEIPTSGKTVIELADICLDSLEKALAQYGVALDPDVIGAAVLDHGAAPAGESERLFRFKFLESRLTANRTVEALIFGGNDVPAQLTRMPAVVRSVRGIAPVVLMDTGAAAVLGSSLDGPVLEHGSHIGVNLGNSHTVAFNLSGREIHGMFEHHTSLVTLARAEALIAGLRAGTIQPGEVWREGGHGNIVFEKMQNSLVAVTGPRRALLRPSSLKPYFAAPFGSMMLAGCFGLAEAVAIKFPKWQEPIHSVLKAGGGS